jgi:hypothetical protein
MQVIRFIAAHSCRNISDTPPDSILSYGLRLQFEKLINTLILDSGTFKPVFQHPIVPIG